MIAGVPLGHVGQNNLVADLQAAENFDVAHGTAAKLDEHTHCAAANCGPALEYTRLGQAEDYISRPFPVPESPGSFRLPRSESVPAVWRSWLGGMFKW